MSSEIARSRWVLCHGSTCLISTCHIFKCHDSCASSVTHMTLSWHVYATSLALLSLTNESCDSWASSVTHMTLSWHVYAASLALLSLTNESCDSWWVLTSKYLRVISEFCDSHDSLMTCLCDIFRECLIISKTQDVMCTCRVDASTMSHICMSHIYMSYICMSYIVTCHISLHIIYLHVTYLRVDSRWVLTSKYLRVVSEFCDSHDSLMTCLCDVARSFFAHEWVVWLLVST